MDKRNGEKEKSLTENTLVGFEVLTAVVMKCHAVPWKSNNFLEDISPPSSRFKNKPSMNQVISSAWFLI